jgi:uncharacterized protein YndB with AHSA1/START domain
MAIEDAAVRREITFPVDRETAWRALQESRWLAEEWVHFAVEEIVERRRVTLRWSEPDAPETLVELTLDDVPEGTRLVVLELPLAQLEAVGVSLEQELPRFSSGPRMLATVA